uniref:Putative secreted protein n=1 Tax=Ixodes ricinus TaxID=34613 RepID=A0A6B0UX73_IXORI
MHRVVLFVSVDALLSFVGTLSQHTQTKKHQLYAKVGIAVSHTLKCFSKGADDFSRLLGSFRSLETNSRKACDCFQAASFLSWFCEFSFLLHATGCLVRRVDRRLDGTAELILLFVVQLKRVRPVRVESREVSADDKRNERSVGFLRGVPHYVCLAIRCT